jgi:hypothetical protein
MPIPRSVTLKLDRVEEHMDALREARTDFFKAEPFTAMRVVESDGHEHVFYWSKYTETPDAFGLIARDAIHNLRSSLDHLTVALAEAGSVTKGVVMTREEIARLQFPVVTEDSYFMNELKKGRLLNLEQGAVDFIKSCQPYARSPNDPKRNPLYLLSDLDNADKHRLVTTAALVPIATKLDWPPDIKNTPLQHPAEPVRYEVGAELGRFVFDSPQSEVNVPVEFGWAIGIWLGERWGDADIDYILRGYIKHVRDIVWSTSYQFLGGAD